MAKGEPLRTGQVEPPFSAEVAAEILQQTMAKPGGDGLIAEIFVVQIAARAARGVASPYDLQVLKNLNLAPLQPEPDQSTG